MRQSAFKKIFNFRYTVLLLGVRELVGNFLTLSKVFVCSFKLIFFLDFSFFEGGTHSFTLNIGKEISLYFS